MHVFRRATHPPRSWPRPSGIPRVRSRLRLAAAQLARTGLLQSPAAAAAATRPLSTGLELTGRELAGGDGAHGLVSCLCTHAVCATYSTTCTSGHTSDRARAGYPRLWVYPSLVRRGGRGGVSYGPGACDAVEVVPQNTTPSMQVNRNTRSPGPWALSARYRSAVAGVARPWAQRAPRCCCACVSLAMKSMRPVQKVSD
jgi:hypothetical protein